MLSNLKVVSDCGWYPANRKLLEHQELRDDTITAPAAANKSLSINTVAGSSSDGAIITLNVGNGTNDRCIDCIIQSRMRNAKSREAVKKKKERGVRRLA